MIEGDVYVMPGLAEMTRDAGVWVVPTNSLLENVFNPEFSPEAMSALPGTEFV
ncbi:MAG: hypothetical protein GVY02_08370 [Bacteroidetes bacterium]|nr:hypothetical protein [Bacteroidota bacterium]